jgi:hypothetical protein
VRDEQKSIAQVLSELWELLVSYAKQETVEPLKGLGRFVGYGLLSALLLSIGVLLLTLSGLRFLQVHTDTHLTGSWSWVPYFAALVILSGLIALIVRAIRPKGSRR